MVSQFDYTPYCPRPLWVIEKEKERSKEEIDLESDSKWMEEQKEKDREMEKGGKGKRGREKVILPTFTTYLRVCLKTLL